VIDGNTHAVDVNHHLWLLSEQDCDLAQTLEDDSEKLFELRTIRSHGGDVPSAITGAKARIDRTACLVAMDVSTKVTARRLTANVANRTVMPAERRTAIKTWLGFRYDRPAVPDEALQNTPARLKPEAAITAINVVRLLRCPPHVPCRRTPLPTGRCQRRGRGS
jgi:hypothetical protein